MFRRPSSTHPAARSVLRLPEPWRPRTGSPPPPSERPDVEPELEPEAEAPAAEPIAVVEAALFLAAGPLSAARLARAAGLAGRRDAVRLAEQLRDRLRARRSALEIVEVAGGYRMVTRGEYAPWIEKAAGGAAAVADHGPRLGAAARETLAVVAYRQPVLRAEIEAIRGVGCADALRQLLDADLLRIVGRSKELGRPLLYGTTDRFLEVYGLAKLADLPDRDEVADGAQPSKHNAPADHAA